MQERHMIFRPICLFACLLILPMPTTVPAAEPNVFLLDGHHLQEMQQDVGRRPAEFEEVLQFIRREADAALVAGPWSVMDKPNTPASGDKHDYYSVGPYWWPDPSKPDGLPYIRRDGEVNPERDEYDNVGFSRTRSAVRDLALGWYFTAEDVYAERAALLLRTWFLAPATRMNPHLEYGQAIPGRVDGRGIGIIDTVGLIDLVDSIGLLESSPAWSDSEHRQLQDWFRGYLQWLKTSDHGRDEANTSNNHAIWYDAQVVSFALFVGDRPTARTVLKNVGPRRIATQIEPDGRMPRELARTKSFHYTLYNLRAFVCLARLGDNAGVDLWAYRTKDGRSIEGALDWFAPFVAETKPWTYPQISAIKPSRAASLYLQASQSLDTPAYQKIAATEQDPLKRLLWSVPRNSRK